MLHFAKQPIRINGSGTGMLDPENVSWTSVSTRHSLSKSCQHGQAECIRTQVTVGAPPLSIRYLVSSPIFSKSSDFFIPVQTSVKYIVLQKVFLLVQ